MKAYELSNGMMLNEENINNSVEISFIFYDYSTDNGYTVSGTVTEK